MQQASAEGVDLGVAVAVAQALAALDRHIMEGVAPLVCSGISLYETAASAILLPTRCPG